jgi:hypothetical protein
MAPHKQHDRVEAKSADTRISRDKPTVADLKFTLTNGEVIENPCDPEIHYTTTDGRLTLTNAEGELIEIDGRRFSRPLGRDDDEVAVAEQRAREAYLGA